MGKKTGKISNERFDEIWQEARVERYLRISEQYRDEVPEHIDRAADRAFRQMEAWIAAGAIPSPAPETPPPPVPRRAVRLSAGTGAAKIAAAALGAAVLVAAGSCAAIPALRDAVSEALGIEAVQHGNEPRRSARSPGAYVIPSPGEDYELREDISTDTLAAKWFVAERRLLMVQIAPELQELPTGEGEAVTVGGMVGMVYEVDGDQQLLLRDGGNSILIRMYNAQREELLDYAEQSVLAHVPLPSP